MTTKCLICCTGNINRSAAAHVILDAHNKEGKYEVKSCGTGTVAPKSCKIPKKMRNVLVEMGYDPHGHRSQGISGELLSWADRVIVMGDVHYKYISNNFPEFIGKVENWKVKDPHFSPGDEVHREVAKQIEDRIKESFL